MAAFLPRLFAFERAWADAAFDAIYPPASRSAMVHGIDEMKPAEFLDDVITESSLEPSLGLRVTLWIIALAPLFILRRFATIAEIEPSDRERVLERLLVSPIYAVRQLVAGFKAMGSLLYSQSPAIRRQMNAPAPKPLLTEGSLVRIKTTDRKQAAQAGQGSEHAAE